MAPVVTLAPLQPQHEIVATVSAVKARRALEELKCATCHRRLCMGMRYDDEYVVPRMLEAPHARLSTEDFCRWCARPITEAAHAMCPLEGFVKFSDLFLDRRSPAIPS